MSSRGGRSGVGATRQRVGRVIRYDEVVAGGRRHFLRRATIDMDALAAELSVSRSTLYRVVAGRDRLLGDVLWSLGKPVLDEACRAVPGRDVDGILEISRRFYQADRSGRVPPLVRPRHRRPSASFSRRPAECTSATSARSETSFSRRRGVERFL